MAPAPHIELQLITPEATVLTAEPEMVVVPGTEGEFGVLRDHAPVLSALRPGLVQVHATFEAEPDCYFVSGGFVEAGAGHCVILADEAEPVSAIDADAARQAVADAQGALRAVTDGDDATAQQRAEQALAVAEARRDAVRG